MHRPEVFLTRDDDFGSTEDDSWIQVEDVLLYAPEAEGVDLNVALERFSNVAAEGDEAWVLNLAEGSFGYAGGRFEASITDDANALICATTQAMWWLKTPFGWHGTTAAPALRSTTQRRGVRRLKPR